MTGLLELADRCEKAQGPDRVLDRQIATAAMNWLDTDDRYPPFTASLDAAMTLVPEGALFDVGHFGDEKPGVFLSSVMPVKGKTQSAEAATPALALCAGALRARANEVKP